MKINNYDLRNAEQKINAQFSINYEVIEIFKHEKRSEDPALNCLDEGRGQYENNICWIGALLIPINKDANGIITPDYNDENFLEGLNYYAVIQEMILGCENDNCFPAGKIYCNLYSTEENPDLYCTIYPDVYFGSSLLPL